MSMLRTKDTPNKIGLYADKNKIWIASVCCEAPFEIKEGTLGVCDFCEEEFDLPRGSQGLASKLIYSQFRTTPNTKHIFENVMSSWIHLWTGIDEQDIEVRFKL